MFAFDEKPYKIFYIPVAHSNIETQLRLDNVLDVLRPIFENENIKKTTYDQCKRD